MNLRINYFIKNHIIDVNIKAGITQSELLA